MDRLYGVMNVYPISEPDNLSIPFMNSDNNDI